MIKLNLLIVCLIVIFLAGCGALNSTLKKSGVDVPDISSAAAKVKDLAASLPNPPPMIMIDTGQQDKSKYPANTRWIKPPKIDSKRGRAYLSLNDMEKISRALSEWPQWYKDVKGSIEGLELDEPEVKETKKWYEVW